MEEYKYNLTSEEIEYIKNLDENRLNLINSYIKSISSEDKSILDIKYNELDLLSIKTLTYVIDLLIKEETIDKNEYLLGKNLFIILLN